MEKRKFTRILLKLSGEIFGGSDGYGIDYDAISAVAKNIGKIRKLGIEVAIVNGGGNLFRGRMGSSKGMDEASADYVGMIATIMNSLVLQDALEKIGVATRVLTAIDVNKVAEPYIRRRAIRHMEKGRVVICAGGIGNPCFTTDTAGILRAIELNCEIMLKASNVDGVFDSDPKQNKNAVKYDALSYNEVLQEHLKVLDATAVSLAREKSMPIIVFNYIQDGNLEKIVKGEKVGTLISNKS
jgi:uridylate kinase